jgi:NADPH-dependent ferric siderophore reductase
MTLTARPVTVTEPFRLFHVRVARTERLSPSFARITFTGEDLDRFADNGYDQRIKLVLPLDGRGVVDLPLGPDWYTAWRQLPDDRRNPVRTYTARAVRPELREVDLDMVLHGESGPASRFALHARPGDVAVLLGPDARFHGRHGGVEFAPPDNHRGPMLLAADETAIPAVAGILERLTREAYGEVVLEVPRDGDRLTLDPPAGLVVTWAVRDGARYGMALDAGVRQAMARIGTSGPVRPAQGAEAPDEPADAALWEVPAEAAEGGRLYAWLAGEAATIRGLRRHLVGELGHDRRAVAFMGYWRAGHPEA